MTVAIKAQGTAGGAFSNAVTINIPASRATGDLLIALFCSAGNGGGAWTTPAGWTALPASADGQVRAFYKISDGAEATVASSYNGAVSANVRAESWIVTGHNPTTPITGFVTQSGGSGSPFVLPSVTAASADTGLVQLLVSGNPQSYVAPAGTTKVFDDGINAAGIEIVAAGATGTRSWTSSTGNGAWFTMLAVNPAPSTVVLQSQASAGVTATAAITIAKPFGVVSGDLMLAAIVHSTGSTTGVPAGWSATVTVGLATDTFWKIAGAGEPADYTFTNSSAIANQRGTIVRVTGHSAASPVAASAVPAVVSGTTIVLPSVPVPNNGSGLIQILHSSAFGGADTWTPPVGVTEVYDVPSPNNNAGGYDTLPVAAGASGTRTWTFGDSTLSGAIFTVNASGAPPAASEPAYTFANLSTTVTVNKPASTVTGDLMVVLVATDNGGNSGWRAPSGWKAGLPPANGGTRIFWRVAEDNEPATYTFITTTGANLRAVALRVTGADTIDPVAYAGASIDQWAAKTSSTFPSVTADYANSTLLTVITNSTSSPTYTPPANTTVQWSGATYAVGVETIAAGDTGTRAWTYSPSQGYGGGLLAINPAGTGTPSIRVASQELNNITASTSLPCDKPAGTVTGDLLLALVHNDSGATITPPAGWTSLTSQNNARSFWKVAGSSEPASYTFTASSAIGNSLVQIARVTGAHLTAPIRASDSFFSNAGTGSIVVPGVTATATDTLIQMVVTRNGSLGGVNWTPPSIPTYEDYDGHSGPSGSGLAASGHELLTSTGATGTRTWSYSGPTAANLAGLNVAVIKYVEPPPVSSNVQRAATLFLKNTPTVDTGTGIDVRHLSATQAATNDVTQSVRFTHTQDNVERTFDPANALVATVADASTLQKVGWGLRVTEEMTPTDDTNCNVMLTAGTLTVPIDVNLSMNGAANGGSTTTQNFRASLWRYNPTTDAGTLIASGSQTQAWNTVSLGGDNNTYKTVTISIAIPAAVEFAQGETLLLQVGVQSGTLSNPLTGTTNFDITLRIDNATSRIVFAANQGLRVMCSYTLSAVGEGLASRVLNAGIPRTALGEGLASSTKAAAVSKVFTILGEGLASVSRAITLSRDAVGEGLSSMSRSVAAARTVNVAGEGLVSQNTAVAMSRDAVGEGLASGTKATTASKTFDVAGEGLVSMSRVVLAVRSFTAVGEGLASRGALAITVPRTATGEGITSAARATVVSKTFTAVGEGLATRGPLATTKTADAVGEGKVTEAHPVSAYRTFTLVGDGEILMSGPNGSTITLPLDELPTGAEGPAPVIKKNITYLFG